MKRLLLSTAVIICTLASFGQFSIDAIRTDEDVLNYVREQEYNYRPGSSYSLQSFNFELFGRTRIDTVRMFPGENARFIDSVTKKRWLKADFNGDGKNDLVVYGSLLNHAFMLAFISTGKDKDTCINLGYFTHFDDFPHQIATWSADGINCLLLGRIKSDDIYVGKIADEFFIDTLVYKFDGFIEYKKQVNIDFTAFDSIDSRSASNWQGGEYSYVRIYKNGRAKHVRNRFIFPENNPIENTYYDVKDILTTSVNSTYWQELVNYMDVFQLKDNYTVPGLSDAGTFITTFYFPGGKTKIIRDYSGEGMYSLRLLYLKVYNLVETADWQLVETTKDVLRSISDN